MRAKVLVSGGFACLALLFFVSCGRSGQLASFVNSDKKFCVSDLDCSTLEICSTAHSCESRVALCTESSPCGGDQVCSGGLCLQPGVCYFDYQCPEGTACESFRCLPQRCTRDSECDDGRRCDVWVGSCREDLCFADEECPEEDCCDPLSSACVPSLICERYDGGIPQDCQASSERCDREDNDCDGAIDEDFPELGETCTVGTGICLRIGHWTCNPQQTGLSCDVVPGPADPEVCDGVDNNCNGVIDEGC